MSASTRVILHLLWEAWKFIVVWFMLPVGTVVWWTDPLWSPPWSYPMALYLTGLTFYMMYDWLRRN